MLLFLWIIFRNQGDLNLKIDRQDMIFTIIHKKNQQQILSITIKVNSFFKTG